MTSKERAWQALTERLKSSLPAEAAENLIGGIHTRRFADNLLPGMSQAQIRMLGAQLGGGGGGELRPTDTGRRKAHAPYSSAAMAANAFGRWIGFENDLRIAGLGGFTVPLEIESAQQIAHGGGRAFLDCLLRGPGITVGVESKLTEILGVHRATTWKEPYGRAAMGTVLRDGWRQVFEDSRAGTWQPTHLDVEQLIKHALALTSRFPDDELHLVYVWWEPANADEVPEVAQHRREVEELRARVGDAVPHLHLSPYDRLLSEWEALVDPPWIRDHVAELRDRYVVTI